MILGTNPLNIALALIAVFIVFLLYAFSRRAAQKSQEDAAGHEKQTDREP
jgi:divalent metal cation (Fe/Co/Zn/Cd) transporter